MSNSEIVRQLVVGQQNIDRMKFEVQMVVGMILGLLDDPNIPKHVLGKLREDQKGLSEGKRFWTSKSCRWDIDDSRGPNHRFSMVCVVSGDSRMSYFTTLPERFNLGSVQQVHESLPALIKELRKVFPVLEIAWSPILRAAVANV
jgi:hypothetical protein